MRLLFKDDWLKDWQNRIQYMVLFKNPIKNSKGEADSMIVNYLRHHGDMIGRFVKVELFTEVTLRKM